MTDAELIAAMKAKGMLSIDEILAGNLMGIYSTHKHVTDLEGLLWWVESKHKEYFKMRLSYEVGGKEKDDLFEWVFAHSAVFSTIADHMRKCLPEIKSSHSKESSSE